MPVRGQVSVLLSTDAEIKRLNREFRGLNDPTDVLSFPAPPGGKDGAGFHPEVAGDLAISLDAAARQAKQFRHPLLTEVKILLLHGLLHLAGHDHETDSGDMAALEEELRRRFRLPSALLARNGHGSRTVVPRKQAGRR